MQTGQGVTKRFKNNPEVLMKRGEEESKRNGIRAEKGKE